MKIELVGSAKRYNAQWIFRKLDYTFEGGLQYALLGNNGSGKSTLMRCLIGLNTLSRGSISWYGHTHKIPPGKVHKHLSYAAPGIDLVESMTLQELLRFHYSFKKLAYAKDIDELLQIADLAHAADTRIEDLSSGMKQRAKLLQAFFSHTEMLFLDEPCSNMDAAGIQFYQECMQRCTKNRLVVIASNDAVEYAGVHRQLLLSDYKTA